MKDTKTERVCELIVVQQCVVSQLQAVHQITTRTLVNQPPVEVKQNVAKTSKLSVVSLAIGQQFTTHNLNIH